jgi:hypothetical protein
LFTSFPIRLNTARVFGIAHLLIQPKKNQEKTGREPQILRPEEYRMPLRIHLLAKIASCLTSSSNICVTNFLLNRLPCRNDDFFVTG